jgi:hypothetical protein
MQISKILKAFSKIKMTSVLSTSTCLNGIPMIGLGTFRADDKEILLNAVKHAIRAGYYFFKTTFLFFFSYSLILLKHLGYRHLDCGNFSTRTEA